MRISNKVGRVLVKSFLILSISWLVGMLAWATLDLAIGMPKVEAWVEAVVGLWLFSLYFILLTILLYTKRTKELLELALRSSHITDEEVGSYERREEKR